MSNHDMKIRYKMTSLLACKNVNLFLPNIRTRPLRSVRFGSVRKCHVRFGGSATALTPYPTKQVCLKNTGRPTSNLSPYPIKQVCLKNTGRPTSNLSPYPTEQVCLNNRPTSNLPTPSLNMPVERTDQLETYYHCHASLTLLTCSLAEGGGRQPGAHVLC